MINKRLDPRPCATRGCKDSADWSLFTQGRMAFHASYCEQHLDLSNRLPLPDEAESGFTLTVSRVGGRDPEGDE